METLVKPRTPLVFPHDVKRMVRRSSRAVAFVFPKPSCASGSSGRSRPRGEAHFHSPPEARVRSARIHDLSCFSHPITHSAAFTYRGQGWMKGLLNKWGEWEGEDGRGGRGHAELHIHQRELILSFRLCLHRACGHRPQRCTPWSLTQQLQMLQMLQMSSQRSFFLHQLKSSGFMKSCEVLKRSWHQFECDCPRERTEMMR